MSLTKLRPNGSSLTKMLVIFVTIGILMDPVYAVEIIVPQIPGLKVRAGKTAVIPGATNSIAHQFEDGRIVVMGEGDEGIWSSDGGRTWKKGPRGPDDKTTINLRYESGSNHTGSGHLHGISDISIRVDHQIWENVVSRVEWINSDDDTAGSDDALVFNLIYSF